MTHVLLVAPRRRLRHTARPLVRDRRGVALLAVLLVAMVATVLALATAMITMSNVLVQASSDRAAIVDDAALSGLEEERSRLNARLDTVPATGYTTIESNVVVPNSSGVRRSTWISRLGNADSLSDNGEFGVHAEVVSQAVDSFGTIAIRRAQMYQESFARYAAFVDEAHSSTGAILYWSLGALAQGPVHSNDTIFIWNGGTPSPQATFTDDVTTTRIVLNKSYATFSKGPPMEGVARIPLPTTTDLYALQAIASQAGYAFTPNVTTGDSAQATMRIEFVAIDVDGDGTTTGPDEGYFKVYQLHPSLTYGAGFTMARPPAPPSTASGAPIPSGALAPIDSLLYSYNCGVMTTVSGLPATPTKFAEIPHVAGVDYQDIMLNKANAYDDVNARCFLGGDDRLSPTGAFRAVDAAGYWMPRTSGTVPSIVASRADGAYLWPLSAAHNPSFRGVIFADGKVAVSGVVRGRITLVSRDNLMLVHDLKQATSPGATSGNCTADDDVIGLFSGERILYGDNALVTPQWRRTNLTGDNWTWPRKEFDPSGSRPDMAIHASMLALKSIGTENVEPPVGLPPAQYVNRGTVRLIGGTIEARTGSTSTINGWNVHGYNRDLSFNRCMLQYPPPYFPTTGRWTRSQFFEVNPQGFSAASWFSGR